MTTARSPIVSALSRFVATAGGAGYSPVAPGTCGTLVAVPIAWMCRGITTPAYLGVVLVVTFLGIAAAHVADQVWNTHDSGRIVIDEVAGYLLTVALLDRGDPWVLGVGFVVFRAFDIIKPPPVRWLDENLPGGWGVVLDDVAAGAMGLVTMIGLQHYGAFAVLARIG